MSSARILLVFLAFLAVGKGQGEDCSVFPIDPVVKLGSDIQIFFSPSQDSQCQNISLHDWSHLYWELNDEEIPRDLYNFSSTVYSVLIRNVSGTWTVTFKVKLDGRDLILGGTDIKAGLLPEKPSNIYCITIFLESFTCYWDPGKDTLPDTSYTVFREVDGETDNCTAITNECTFDNENVYIIWYQKISVRAENVLGTVMSDSVGFDLLTTVKINPPEYVVVEPMRNNVLRVTWRRPRKPKHFKHLPLKCEVESLESTSNTTARYLCYKTQPETVCDIEHVKPCLNYTVSVRCALEDGTHWSEWSERRTVLSLLDVRLVKLDLWRKMEAPDAKGNRKVLLMWKGMQPPDACSALQGYQMTITPGDGHPQTLFFNLSEWRTWTVLGKEAHRISIIAYTSNDTSPGDTLTIPAVGAELPSVAGAQASPHDNQIRISWNNSHIPVQKYVIDWSTDGETYDWHATNSTSFSLTGELEPFKCYSIAVTPLYEDEAGREVTLQTYLEEGVPGQIQKVEVLDVQDDAATIKWTAVPEQERRGCIRNYTVYYASETGLVLSDTVNASVFEYHLTRLRPSTKYTLYVLASTGKGGTNSSMSVFTTFQYGASFMKVALLCGGLGIVFMASIVISCFIMARKHLFPKLNIPSSIADLPFQHSPKASLNNLGHCPETIVKVFHVIEPLNLKCPELGCSFENTVVQPPGLDLSSGGKPTTDVPSATDDSATSLNEPGCPVLSADEQSADEQSADSTSYTEGAEERLLIPSSYVKHGESSPPNSSSGPAQEPATGPDQKVPRNPQQSIPGPAYVTVHMFTQTADCTRLL